jgi:hypothetical protein
VLVDGMTITPASGTYYAIFTAEWSLGGNNSAFFSIYAAGAQIVYSERETDTDDTMMTVSTTAKVTVNGSQAVEVYARRSAGTFDIFNRQLFLLKIS